jgi:hypothetical protein
MRNIFRCLPLVTKSQLVSVVSLSAWNSCRTYKVTIKNFLEMKVNDIIGKYGYENNNYLFSRRLMSASSPTMPALK